MFFALQESLKRTLPDRRRVFSFSWLLLSGCSILIFKSSFYHYLGPLRIPDAKWDQRFGCIDPGWFSSFRDLVRLGDVILDDFPYLLYEHFPVVK